MKNIVYLVLIVFLYSCEEANPDDGFYIKKDYVEYCDSLTRKGFELNQSRILIKIAGDTIYQWGDIKYWGDYSAKQSFPFLKIKEQDQIKYLYKVDYDGFVDYFEYIKINNNEAPIDSLGLDFSCLSKIKAEKVLANNYLLGNKKISFSNEGLITGLKQFKTYSVFLRRGTNFPYEGSNLIKTEEGIWEFKIRKNQLILRRYKDSRNPETEIFDLSDEKIILNKINNN